MLQHSAPQEFDEAVDIVERATARAARRRDPDEEPPRERYWRSAERRANGAAPPSLAEMGEVFGLAMAKLAEERRLAS